MFIFHQLHNVHLKISKLLEEYAMSYLLSNRLITERKQREGKWFVKIPAGLLRGCNLFLSTIEIDGGFQELV